MITIKPINHVVVLTGAGISAESGVKTFRDNNGLWEEHRIEDVATPEAFDRNPRLVWKFYNERIKQAQTIKPNPAHCALKKLEDYLQDNFTLITQNVDPLHQMAGSKRILTMHGELFKVRCTKCSKITTISKPLADYPLCDCSGLLRPHIVWFGEIPFYMDEIQKAAAKADYFITVGTSGVVYPAAGLLAIAQTNGATTIGVNLEKPDNAGLIDHFFQGKAGEILPNLINQLIG